MIGKILSVLLLFVLIGATFGVASCSGTTSPQDETPTSIEKPGSKVIEITVEKLVSDILANPNRYKKGTVFQVSGITTGKARLDIPNATTECIWLGPEVNGFYVRCDLEVSTLSGKPSKDRELAITLKSYPKGTQVVVQGTYDYFYEDQYWGGAILEDCSLITK